MDHRGDRDWIGIFHPKIVKSTFLIRILRTVKVDADDGSFSGERRSFAYVEVSNHEADGITR